MRPFWAWTRCAPRINLRYKKFIAKATISELRASVTPREAILGLDTVWPQNAPPLVKLYYENVDVVILFAHVFFVVFVVDAFNVVLVFVFVVVLSS